MIRLAGIILLIHCLGNVCFGQEGFDDQNYISKGQWLVGGGLSFSADKDSKNYRFSVSPDGGYLLGKKIAVGLSTGYYYNHYNKSGYSSFSAQPFLRYYVTQKRLAPYGEISYGAAWFKTPVYNPVNGEVMEERVTNVQYRIGVGLDYFLTKNVAIEGNLLYSHDSYFVSRRINFTVGLQFFIQ